MKIRYLENKENQRSSSAELLSGHIYPVLALMVDLSSKMNTAVVLHDDLHSPVQIKADTFEVVDQSIPKMWEIEVTLDSVLMAPREWQSKDFWRDLFNGTADALREFERILPGLCEQIAGESPRGSAVN